MKISDMLVMCLRSLWRRKGRTLLTVTGVVIGCCAIIVMISLGLGMNQAMDNMLASLGDLTAVTIYNNSYYQCCCCCYYHLAYIRHIQKKGV